jgi:hypothetical protein
VWYVDCKVVPSLGDSLEPTPSRSISRSRVSSTWRHTPCDAALVTSTNMDFVFSEIYRNKIVGVSLSILCTEKYKRMTPEHRNLQFHLQQNYINSVLNMHKTAIKLAYKGVQHFQTLSSLIISHLINNHIT